MFLLGVFRRIKRAIRKKFLLLINSRFRKHLIGLGKIRGKQVLLLDELSKLLLEEKNIPPLFIWDIVITEENLRESALRLFLNHPELSFGQIYEAAVNVPLNEQDADYLQNALWIKLVELGLSPQDLMDMTMEWPQFFQKKALEDLTEKIKSNKIRKDCAKRILKTLMEDVSHLREPLCKLYLTLDPSSRELQELLDAKWLYSMPVLGTDIEKRARNVHKHEKAKKRYEEKIRKRIDNIFKKIAKTKKGPG
jgi:hypothetical protein